MTIDKEYFENTIWTWGRNEGKKMYHFEKVADNIGLYSDGWIDSFFELDTLEKIGTIQESDVRASRNNYYTARCIFGWDGKRATKKDMIKTLCTRGDYSTARALLMQEYKNRKQ